MVNLDITVDEQLDKGISRLAVKHYGDDSESSRQRVIETALMMRILWSRSVDGGQQDTEEAATNWEFPQSSVTKEDTGTISDWLFRR